MGLCANEVTEKNSLSFSFHIFCRSFLQTIIKLTQTSKKANCRIISVSTRQVLQHVSNFVRDGVIGVAESANLHREVGQLHSTWKKNGSGASAHDDAKLISEDSEQFKKIQESLRMKGCLTHFAIKQILPDVIESFCSCNTNRHSINNSRQQSNTNQFKFNCFKKQQRRKQGGEDKKMPSQNKNREVLIKTEKMELALG